MNVAPALSHLLAGVGTPKSPPRTRSGGRERVRRAYDAADFRADAPHQIKPGSITPFPHPSRHHQRGAMAITIAIMLLGLIFMLGLVEIGYLYWAKRDTQKVADLAALSGAQRLPECEDAKAAAATNATTNFGSTVNWTADPVCGTWTPPPPNCDDTGHPTDCSGTNPCMGFTPLPPGGNDANALCTHATRQVDSFLGLAGALPDVEAVGIATHSEPIAAFSVGSRLLGLSPSGPLNTLLESALGTSLGLQLLSYEGIANTNVSLLGLRDLLNLDAGTVDEVLDAQVNIGEFLDAVVVLLGESDNSAEIDLSAIGEQITAIKAQLGDAMITLRDLLNVSAELTNPDTALAVDVNVADLLRGALMVANGEHAVDLEALDIELPGLASVNLKLAIVEPPKIGVGLPGYDDEGRPKTVAHTAQVRLKLDVRVAGIGESNTTLLDVLHLLTLTLPSGSLTEIPLNLELVPGEAWLDDLQCLATGSGGTAANLATLQARPGALAAFLGNLPEDTYENDDERWQDIVDDAIADGSAFADLLGLRLKVILIPALTIQLQAYSSAPVVRANDASHTFEVDPQVPVAEQDGMTWSVDTGQQLLGSALAALFAPDLLHTRLQLDGLGLAGLVVSTLVNNLADIVRLVLSILNPVLAPVFNALDTTLIGPLLRVLGVDVGASDVNLMSVNCDFGAKLVY